MHTFRSRQHARRFTSVMLFVWLFAMTIGWGHACGLSADRTADHHGSGLVVALQGAGQHSALGASGACVPEAGLKACAGSCEADQDVLVKGPSAKGHVGTGLSHGLVNPAGVWSPALSGAAPVRWHPLAGPPRVVTPVTIAFLRMTI